MVVLVVVVAAMVVLVVMVATMVVVVVAAKVVVVVVVAAKVVVVVAGDGDGVGKSNAPQNTRVHASTPLLQLQVLQELLPPSFPLQPEGRTAPPVSVQGGAGVGKLATPQASCVHTSRPSLHSQVLQESTPVPP